MPISEIDKILNKYKEKETDIEHLLNVNTRSDDSAAASEPQCEPSKQISLVEVQARNKQIMKNLETVKANLRSKAIFSPSEMQWQRIYYNYNQCPSMPVTTYKCHKAVFV